MRPWRGATESKCQIDLRWRNTPMRTDAYTRIEGYPFLVQRLRHHEARGVEHNIARYFDFDYMGSSEFEAGAIPRSKKILNAALPLGTEKPEPVKLSEGEHTAWYVGPNAHLEMARTWFREELAADATGMLERSNLRETYTKPTERSCNGWFCVDGGWREGRQVWALFTKKDFARDFIKGLRGTP